MQGKVAYYYFFYYICTLESKLGGLIFVGYSLDKAAN